MKSRTSFFEQTVLRKDITRFAPLWAIYFIGGLLVMLNITNVNTQNGYYAGISLGETINYLAIENMIYACLAAQLLFGDLYNSRLCNALHAMPLRRENWFITHFVSGMLFSLVPNSVAMLIIMFRLGQFWYVAFIWLLGMTLQYLFFFALAVFSVFCTGNRFGMLAVYGILNGASMIAYWFLATVYQPMMFGVEFATEPFLLLCPVAQLTRAVNMLIWNVDKGGLRVYSFDGFGDGWGYLAVLGVLGIALSAVSLVMYRRRKLETAGDFIAVSPLAPIFCVVYTLCVGAIFAMFGSLVGEAYMPYLLVGIAVGWFTGRMLLQRTVKVFSGKNFLRFGVVIAAVLLSIGLTKLDLLGITSWLPDADRVESVTVSDTRNYYYNGGYEGKLTVQDPEKIQSLIDVHQYIIEKGQNNYNSNDKYITLSITYKMKDGKQVDRHYETRVNEEIFDQLRIFFSDPNVYFPYADWQTNPKRVNYVEIDSQKIDEKFYAGLFAAIEKDALDGRMAYSYQFHDNSDVIKLWITITYVQDNNIHDTREVRVYGDCENTIAWLKENQHVWYYEESGMTVETILGK